MPTKTKVDKSVERSRKRAEFRQAVIKAGALSQVKISRERGKQRRSVERTKTEQRVIERQQSEAARVNAYRERSNIAIAQKHAIRQERIDQDRNRKIATSVGGAIYGSSAWSMLISLTVLFFVMIVLYLIVHNSSFGTLAGSLGNFISGLSSTRPLFLKKPVDTNDDEHPTNKVNPPPDHGGTLPA